MSAFISDRLPELGPQFCLLVTWALLHFIWQGCLLAVGFAIVRRALGPSSANFSYAAGIATLVLMAACLPLTLSLIDPPVLEPLPAAELTAQAAAPTSSDLLEPLSGESAEHQSSRESAAADSVQTSLAAADPSDPQLAAETDFWHGLSWWSSAARWSSVVLWSVSAYATGAYVVGLALMLTRVLVGLWLSKGLRRESIYVTDLALLELVRTQAARMSLRVVPTIAWCRRVTVPLVVGVVRPMILLPFSLAVGLTDEQLELVLLHELAHIHRFDPIVNLLQRLIEALLFFHPAVWWLSRQVSIERENACDDAVLRAGCQGPAYADALLRVAEICVSYSGRAVSPAGALAATGGSQNQLRRRILRLFNADSPAPLRPASPAAALVLLLSASAIIALAIWRSPANAQLAGESLTPQQDLAVAALDPVAIDPAVVAPLALVEAEEAVEWVDFGPPANAAPRVLHFPVDRSLGLVSWRPASGDYVTPNMESVWKPLGDARGEVSVPAGCDIRLIVRETSDGLSGGDLSALDALAPNDIQYLHLRDKLLSEDCLRHVGRLTDLRLLALFAKPVTDAGLAEIVRIKQLTTLSLNLPNITAAGFAALQELPMLENLRLGKLKGGIPIDDAALAQLGTLTNLKLLNLPADDLTDAGLAHLKPLAQLQSLALLGACDAMPQLTEAGLVHLEPLRSLKHLDLPTRIEITDLGVASLARLQALQSLNSGLTLSDEGLAQLASLQRLKQIDLHCDRISAAGMQHIARMRGLESLGFHDCSIGEAAMAHLVDLPKLRVLRLYHTSVGGRGIAALAQAPALREMQIWLERQSVLRVALQQIGQLEQLKGLFISGSPTSQDLSQLAGLVNLESICVDAPVDNLGAFYLAQLPALKTLNVNHSKITDSGLNELVRLGGLERLIISGFFSDQGLGSLGQLKSLKFLEAGSPFVSQAGADLLTADLPGLEHLNVRTADPLENRPQPAGEKAHQIKAQAAPNAAGQPGTHSAAIDRHPPDGNASSGEL
jgi:beta-lactamase regulating signal transducer with metallopeptidase domain